MPRTPDHLASTIQKHGSVALKRQSTAEIADPFNTDEWEPSQGPFWVHALAGSIAGVAEHSVMFPIDTMKTHAQVLRATPSTIAELVASCGVPRLWRGVQTMFVGCIPAHAAYFTIYESCKPAFTHQLAGASSTHIDRFAGTLEGSTAAAVGSGTAVTVATVAHDCIMTPMDTIKQRLQLGLHNNSMLHCFGAVVRTGGQRALVISLPVTLCMNMPYAAVMGTTNELLRKRLSPSGDPPSAAVYMAAGAGSGALAAAATTPLDAVKTRLQTQHLGKQLRGKLVHETALQACRSVYREGGWRAFFRGVAARVLLHAPSVGICWTSYETARALLMHGAGEGATAAASQPPRVAPHDASPEAQPAAKGEAALPFLDHMLAGSLAGIAEHVSVYPIDTVKTHVQASAEEAAAGGTLRIARALVAQHGIRELFRGISALVPAIGPAHALMFSSYEQVLRLGGAKQPGASAERTAAAGALADVVSVVLHDACMVPAETVKQRLQLGYYRNALHCCSAMLATGGSSFFRSLPTTLAMNVPYGSVMMSANESLKRWLNPSGGFDLSVFLLSGGLSGAVAAALTTPLDVVSQDAAADTAPRLSFLRERAFLFQVVKTRLQLQSLTAHATDVGAAPGAFSVRYGGFVAAARSIHAERGLAGFLLGVGPRVAMYGPSCAVSWVAYESCKKLLLQARGSGGA